MCGGGAQLPGALDHGERTAKVLCTTPVTHEILITSYTVARVRVIIQRFCELYIVPLCLTIVSFVHCTCSSSGAVIVGMQFFLGRDKVFFLYESLPHTYYCNFVNQELSRLFLFVSF